MSLGVVCGSGISLGCSDGEIVEGEVEGRRSFEGRERAFGLDGNLGVERS